MNFLPTVSFTFFVKLPLFSFSLFNFFPCLTFGRAQKPAQSFWSSLTWEFFNNPFRTCPALIRSVWGTRDRAQQRRNVKHKKYTRYDTPKSETFRDESNGTTKSKNKLHLTIFHKRMTSWFRKKYESLLRKQVRSEARSNERESARRCYFFPIGLVNI